jgi:hypothetical protein
MIPCPWPAFRSTIVDRFVRGVVKSEARELNQ